MELTFCDLSNKFQNLYINNKYYIDCLELLENEVTVSLFIYKKGNYIHNRRN